MPGADDGGIDREPAVRRAPREDGLREAVGLGPDGAVGVVDGEPGLEVVAVLHPRRVAFGDGGVLLRGAGGGGADGVEVAVRENRAVGDGANAFEVADEGTGVGARAFGGARRVAAREGRAAVGGMAREAADTLTALDGAEAVGVGEERRGIDLAREAARVGGVARVRGRRGGVAEGEALAHGGVAAALVAEEAADILLADHRADGHAAPEVVGVADLADEAADIRVAGIGDAAEGAAKREAETRRADRSGEAADVGAGAEHRAIRLAVHVLRTVAARAAGEAADGATALREAPGDAAREVVGGTDVADEAAHRVG